MTKSGAMYITEELILVHGITEGPNGEKLSDMDYRSLVSLLAVQGAVAE
ncbi:hypothetical protein [Sporosarcina psychrophila]|uniref:Uncharacterized protein n=1 Tax=Sporosarcina psychrophila TaxID=1476 RepID=A0ABV2KCY8_SPOPS